mmetsp:Transcript_40892/g.98608  ORF Transcript_40892/g.98608 Transcript_40892/m.98608 type:complete len:123 (+) Transcript_40892:3487-3855(+)
MSPLDKMVPIEVPPVSTVIAKVHVKTPTAAKNPQMTGKGKKEPRLASRKTLDSTKSDPEKEMPIADRIANVPRKRVSFSDLVTSGSFARVSSTITAKFARKGAKKRSTVGYKAGTSELSVNQ